MTNLFQILRLSKISLDNGHVMELVCNDSQRIIFTSAEWFIPYAIHHALFSACVIGWLLYFIGWQIIPGALFLLVFAVIRVLLNKFDFKLRKSASELSDQRLFRQLSEKQCLCLPTSIRYIIDVRTALQRMETFLNKHEDSVNIDRDLKSTSKSDEDVAKIPHLRPNTCPAVHDEISPSNSSIPNPPYLQLHKVTCQLPSRVSAQPSDSNCAEILKDVTLSVTSPALVLVCGPVGSGKSSLLATVLGEFLVTNGSVKYSGTLGYVSDTPWVFPGTVRDSVLFGLPYDEKFYAKVIKACQLENDLRTSPQQDLAVIGEHGATVSGGQRTSISLARAVYSQADIYLLDDPLSSLDAQVAENVFR